MEENEYKSAYNTIANIRCVFEKALTNHHAQCHLAAHFCLADREGYACQHKQAASRCKSLLEKLRENASFALKLPNVGAPLAHNKEIRVQVGGLTGLAKLAPPAPQEPAQLTPDIDETITAVITHYGSIDALPYNEIMQSVVQFKGRRKRQNKR